MEKESKNLTLLKELLDTMDKDELRSITNQHKCVGGGPSAIEYIEYQLAKNKFLEVETKGQNDNIYTQVMRDRCLGKVWSIVDWESLSGSRKAEHVIESLSCAEVLYNYITKGIVPKN